MGSICRTNPSFHSGPSRTRGRSWDCRSPIHPRPGGSLAYTHLADKTRGTVLSLSTRARNWKPEAAGPGSHNLSRITEFRPPGNCVRALIEGSYEGGRSYCPRQGGRNIDPAIRIRRGHDQIRTRRLQCPTCETPRPSRSEPVWPQARRAHTLPGYGWTCGGPSFGRGRYPASQHA